MRRMILAFALLSLPVGTSAGTHRAGAGGGGGRAGGSDLWGALISAELVIKHFGEGSPAPFTLSAVGDLTWMSGDREGFNSFNQVTLVGGVRGTYNSLKRIAPFGHAMAGRYWATGPDKGAMALGGGVDILLGRAASEGLSHWGIRLQGDYYWTGVQDRSFSQFTAQFVYRIE
jgi:hypothetical protein